MGDGDRARHATGSIFFQVPGTSYGYKWIQIQSNEYRR